MNQRILGKTGISVSEIGIGAWQLGGPLDLDGKQDGHPDLAKDFVINLIRSLGERGINFIDTAEQYGGGESERRVGEALQGNRDQWVISTKFGSYRGPQGERVNDVSAARVPLALEGSLQRLRTDFIDVYVYHIAPDRNEAEAVAEFLNNAKSQGKVRAVGISTNDLATAEYLHPIDCLDVVQFASSILNPQTTLTDWLATYSIGGVVRGAFAGGRLSGKYFENPPALADTDIRKNWLPADADQLRAEFAKYAAFEPMLTGDRTMVDLAIGSLLRKPTTHTIILGAKSLTEYENGIAATAKPPLTTDEIHQLERIAAVLA